MTRARLRSITKVAAAGAFAVLAMLGLRVHHHRHPPHVAPAHAAAVTAAAPDGFAGAVEAATRKRKLAEMMADAAPGSWSRRAAAASTELSYAQLTGDYAAYSAASESLETAFKVARSSLDDDAVGPLLLRAQLDYELHRLRPALASLDVPERQAEFFHDQKLGAEIASLRGAVTFALGDYDAGLGLLRRSIELDPSPGHKQRLAIALSKVGGDAEAQRLLDDTVATAKSEQSIAWIESQRATMALARGDRALGRRHLENARELFPGSWQTDEKLAELDVTEGREDRAREAYRDLVARTSDPEFMDALARLVENDAPAEAQSLRARADAIYEDRLAKLPEASYGHALEHFLKERSDAGRALAVALENRDLRPNGEARTRLAQAYVKAGRLAEARAEIRAVTTSAWVSAETYATASVIASLSHDDRTSAEMARRATELNPHALEEIAWLAPGRT